ncbi:unnamed protein product, partial [Soboliphyme baturini]|uniref:Uncharacterized protein n=1 Tax=Soboliphyme baturini TaxID=241478 RepID=A0A183IV16_9BILA
MPSRSRVQILKRLDHPYEFGANLQPTNIELKLHLDAEVRGDKTERGLSNPSSYLNPCRSSNSSGHLMCNFCGVAY